MLPGRRVADLALLQWARGARHVRVRRGDEEWHVDADGTSVRLTPLLRDYAATNPGEFFAVVTEVFFTRPRELRARIPDLYAVFANYYAQDPAIRRDARDQSGV